MGLYLLYVFVQINEGLIIIIVLMLYAQKNVLNLKDQSYKGGSLSEQLALKGYVSIWYERRKITLNMLEKCMKFAIIDDNTLTLFIL